MGRTYAQVPGVQLHLLLQLREQLIVKRLQLDIENRPAVSSKAAQESLDRAPSETCAPWSQEAAGSEHWTGVPNAGQMALFGFRGPRSQRTSRLPAFPTDPCGAEKSGQHLGLSGNWKTSATLAWGQRRPPSTPAGSQGSPEETSTLARPTRHWVLAGLAPAATQHTVPRSSCPRAAQHGSCDLRPVPRAQGLSLPLSMATGLWDCPTWAHGQST